MDTGQLARMARWCIVAASKTVIIGLFPNLTIFSYIVYCNTFYSSIANCLHDRDSLQLPIFSTLEVLFYGMHNLLVQLSGYS